MQFEFYKIKSKIRLKLWALQRVILLKSPRGGFRHGKSCCGWGSVVLKIKSIRYTSTIAVENVLTICCTKFSCNKLVLSVVWMAKLHLALATSSSSYIFTSSFRPSGTLKIEGCSLTRTCLLGKDCEVTVYMLNSSCTVFCQQSHQR